MKPIAWILVILFVIFAVALFIVKKMPNFRVDSGTVDQNITAETKRQGLLDTLGTTTAKSSSAERNRLAESLGKSANPQVTSQQRQSLLDSLK